MAQVERLRNFFREHPVGGAPGRAPSGNSREAPGEPPPTPARRSEAHLASKLQGGACRRLQYAEGSGRGVRSWWREANRERVDGASEARARDARSSSGLGALAQPEEGAEAEERGGEAARRAGERGRRRDFGRADEIRDELAELGWEVRDSAEGAKLVRRGLDGPVAPRSSTASSRSQRRSGETAGAAGPGGLRDFAGGAGASLWIAGSSGRRRRGRALSLRGSRTALLRRDEGLIVALDQVQDPRNLGAVCRSAEFAGATGVIVPERRSAAVTAATCKASAGAVEHLEIAHVRNLADWLARRSRPASDLGADAEARGRPGTSTFAAPRCSSSAARERGSGRGSPPACDGLVALPTRGEIESLERLGGRRGAALRGSAPARLSRDKCSGGCTNLLRSGLTELRAAVN